MALITANNPQKKEKFKIDISKRIYSEIKSYCLWADIDIDYFFEESSIMIFAKDKDWKDCKKKNMNIKKIKPSPSKHIIGVN